MQKETVERIKFESTFRSGPYVCGDKIYNRTADGTTWSTAAVRHDTHFIQNRLAFKHPFSGERMEFNIADAARLGKMAIASATNRTNRITP